ncbi:hypothetical protein PR048_003985 [Dryococelus australis]|uniref:Uncharacterized protein n=1 Tax=Dryococelus australis TaxID=614101 RepID=A0ABQ9I4N4_9NEOP|nr:hypothetical protein PR048_003985 [Dryococelus australis]
MKGWGKREIPEKTRRPTTSSGMIPTCENPEVLRGDVADGVSQARRQESCRCHLNDVVIAGPFSFTAALRCLALYREAGPNSHLTLPATSIASQLSYVHAAQRKHCTRVQRRVRKGDAALGARVNVALVSPLHQHCRGPETWNIREFNDLQARLYSVIYKYADNNCTLVICFHSGRRRLGDCSPGGVETTWTNGVCVLYEESVTNGTRQLVFSSSLIDESRVHTRHRLHSNNETRSSPAPHINQRRPCLVQWDGEYSLLTVKEGLKARIRAGFETIKNSPAIFNDAAERASNVEEAILSS